MVPLGRLWSLHGRAALMFFHPPWGSVWDFHQSTRGRWHWAMCSVVNKQHCTDLCHPKPTQDILVAQFPVSWKGITGMNTGNPNHTPQPKNISTKGTELNQTLCEKFFSTEGHLFQWFLPQTVHWDKKMWFTIHYPAVYLHRRLHVLLQIFISHT